MENSDEDMEFIITPKGVIATVLAKQIQGDIVGITEKIWDELYEYGCQEVGETGLPALVMTKDGGTFVPAFLDTEREEE